MCQICGFLNFFVNKIILHFTLVKDINNFSLLDKYLTIFFTAVNKYLINFSLRWSKLLISFSLL